MTRTGRYRFRTAVYFFRVLQAEYLDAADEFVWRDVDRRDLKPQRVFAVVRPSQWLAFMAANNLTTRIQKADRKKRGKADPEVSRLG